METPLGLLMKFFRKKPLQILLCGSFMLFCSILPNAACSRTIRNSSQETVRQESIQHKSSGRKTLEKDSTRETSDLRSSAVSSLTKKNDIMHTKTIYLAGGCFWGTEHFIKQIRGVIRTKTGYANSIKAAPTYQEVCSGSTQAAETVEVEYDPSQLDLGLLLRLYFKTIDPTSVNRQGNDRGTQYRTGIYYTEPSDRPIIDSMIKQLQAGFTEPVAIEVIPLKNFYAAEDYHQDYLQKNPGGYCHLQPELFVLAREANPLPEKKDFRKPEEAQLRQFLTPLQYAVTRENHTEPPFDNEYWAEDRPGIYVDITTGQPLFLSTDKFESNCGWPSFSKPIDDTLIEEKTDLSHNMRRIEVRSRLGDAHLGHVFPDGPKESGGLRYCINSASIRFIPKEKMESEGYASYLPLLEKSGNRNKKKKNSAENP